MVPSRVLNESRHASVPDCGIYMAPLQPEAGILPLRQFAVLVSTHTPAVPILVQVEWGADYPMTPLKIEFMTRVPHPLIANNGSIDVDILGDRWSPALQARTVLVALQWVLDDPKTFQDHCIHNADWEVGVISTPPEHVPTLFHLLLEAAGPPVDGASLDWFSWLFFVGCGACSAWIP